MNHLQLFLAFGYILSIACWIGTFVGAQYYVDNRPDKWEEIFFISIQKVLFSIAYAWVFYAFSFGKGGESHFAVKNSSRSKLIYVYILRCYAKKYGLKDLCAF